MNKVEVKDKIEKALKKLKDKDFVLLKNDLNERTISHRLAIYIEDIFTEYDVDCEYNKIPEGSKILDIIPRKGSVDDDTKAVTVYPDIIVHKRDTNNNFMVIEIKKSTNNSNKEIDYDKPYKFSIEDLIKKMKDDYKVDLLDVKHVISLYRYEEKKELNIPLYEIWYNYDDLNRNNVECYLINGTTGETLFTIKRFLGDKKGSLLQNYLDSLKNKQKTTSAIYKTHQGKSYTQAEWEAYEEKQYEEYCRRTGRPYTPKNQQANLSDQDNRKSFLANDKEKGDNNTPKKNKGFLGGLFN